MAEKQVVIQEPRTAPLPEVGERFLFLDGKSGKLFQVVTIEHQVESTIIYLKSKRRKK